MRLYMFKSETVKKLLAFADDQMGSKLPPRLGPWTVTGIVGPDKTPPHNLSRDTIEQSIATEGFQLWRRKKEQSPA
jgi:hypothetical protein